MVDKGLLLKSNKGFCCPESIRQTAVRDSLAEDQFSRIAQAVRNNVLLGAAPHKVVLNSYKQYARSMQMALFCSSSIDEIYTILDNGDRDFPDTPSEKDIFGQILAQPFSPAVIEKIHPAMRLSVLGTLLNATNDRLEPTEEICEYMLTSYVEEIHDTPG
ncbi:MAG: hypothetical protein D3924_01065, partial [Candidatus Electrothrix sp. AR4]|nr:hypothetical protein [Candidatus Electrothrix sp. AR4]